MFLQIPGASAAATRLYESDLDSDGYVMNVTRLWAWRPEVGEAFSELRGLLTRGSSLSDRELAVIVSATASTLGDAYCSLAWGETLAAASDASTPAGVLQGTEPGTLTKREAALARWARKVVGDPNGTTPKDVETLRRAGLSEREIFEATAFAAFRIAFSTVNDALGAQPDHQLTETAPREVRDAVTYGRPPEAAGEQAAPPVTPP
jgi:alkylhydroperoxidase family enzyme